MRQFRYLFALIVVAALCYSAQAADPFKYPEGKQGTGELKYIEGIPVLVVSGTPEEMGTAVGALALKPGARVLSYPKALLEEFKAGLFWPGVVKQGKEMFKAFPEPYQKELEAIVKSSEGSRDEVIAGNTVFDIKKLIFCSALMIEPDKSATGGPLLGRNLDYPGLGWAHEYGLVTVYRPKGKHAFVSVGFPGVVGALSGMNDAGLTVAILEVFSAREGEPRFEAKGLPYALCYRTLLEECTTIDEAKKKLESMPRTTMNNLVVADAKGVAVFEITPKSVVVRKAEKGTLSCTNHFCTELKPKQKVDIADSYERYDVLERVREWEKIKVDDVRRALHATNLGNQTLQTMVFEPDTLKLHVSMGKTPSSGQALKTIDLKPLFKPEKK